MKKVRRLLAGALSLTLAAALFTGCGGGDGAAADGAHKYKIGFVLNTLENDFYITMRDAALDYQEQAGNAEIIVQAPEKFIDVNDEVEIIENLLAKNIDALVFSPADGTSFLPVMQQCNEMGIPVILINNTIDQEAAAEQGVEYTSYVGTNNVQGGNIAGEFVKEQYPDGAEIAILTGSPGVQAGDERVQGFKDIFAGDPKYRIVAEQTANWTRDEGYDVAQNIILANPGVDVFYCASDLMAFGAMEAIDQMGKSSSIKAIGFDCSDEAKDLIRQGKLLGSVAQYPDDMAVKSLEAALAVLEGGTVDKYIATKIDMPTKADLEAQ
ncbi:sugar ABC transporter substrate-binding protein [Intestinibacillus massiliensis]|nr:sugar ABC transporter substrate-binding protein [Intestinibacillus massiliensis]